VGVYGIMAYLVSQRTNEIGIRLALGADRKRIQLMVLREACWLAASGIAVGLGATFLLSHVVEDMLYGITTTDPATLAGCALLLAAVAFVAGWLPAGRASRIEPIEALRNE
jgi:ABC-type antimicrobial peptide transport system permease subunit